MVAYRQAIRSFQLCTYSSVIPICFTKFTKHLLDENRTEACLRMEEGTGALDPTLSRHLQYHLPKAYSDGFKHNRCSLEWTYYHNCLYDNVHITDIIALTPL